MEFVLAFQSWKISGCISYSVLLDNPGIFWLCWRHFLVSKELPTPEILSLPSMLTGFPVKVSFCRNPNQFSESYWILLFYLYVIVPILSINLICLSFLSNLNKGMEEMALKLHPFQPFAKIEIDNGSYNSLGDPIVENVYGNENGMWGILWQISPVFNYLYNYHMNKI